MTGREITLSFVFHPNYCFYGTQTDISSGCAVALKEEYLAGNSENVSYPGDQYKGNTIVKVGNHHGTIQQVKFLDYSEDIDLDVESVYVGVGSSTYGTHYEYSTAYIGEGTSTPNNFKNGNDSLYYHGEDEDEVFTFSESAPTYQRAFYTRVDYKEEDIFEEGNIEYFKDIEDNCYSYSNGKYTTITQEETVIEELINQKLTPDVSDVIFNANSALEPQYYGGRLLGFQKKLTNLSDESEKTDSLRFMTVLSSKVLKKLYDNPNTDFGYVFAAIEGDNVNIPIYKVKIDNPKLNKHSCKNTENTLTGSFGDKDFNSTDYKYITAGVDEIPTGYTLCVRFYITYKGETHYITYPAKDKTGIVFDSSDYVS